MPVAGNDVYVYSYEAKRGIIVDFTWAKSAESIPLSKPISQHSLQLQSFPTPNDVRIMIMSRTIPAGVIAVRGI